MYSDFISINKNFQTSINLELDLENTPKIAEYIPTSDICEVLKQYFKSFLGKDKSKATTLVGPYGKGKSFLLLILSYLTNGDYSTDEYQNLLTKIEKIDSVLKDMIIEFHARKMKFLPVVINSNYDDLKQAFRIALDQSLRNYHLNDIIPQSTYHLCLELINNWENDSSLSQKMTNQCKKEFGSVDKLKKGLKDYSSLAFETFKKVYRCMSMGIEFNPLINDDIVKTYSNVLRELNTKDGYTGIFIIFDEFSKFINNASNISRDLKLIQDFAELANRTPTQEQINICCVTHKSLNLYEVNDGKTRDSFKTVEGRFKEVRFNRSLEENYQIISGAIIKKDLEQIKSLVYSNESLYNRIAQASFLTQKRDLDTLKFGCFPLNPVTTYSLIQVSELIAQNERTLFTFLCDADENSFNSFIARNSSGTLNIDSLYDYFSPIMQNSDVERVKNIWIRAEAILDKTTQPVERSIIKALAIIHILNDFIKFPPNIRTLALSLNTTEDSIETNIQPLLDNHYLRTDDYKTKYFFASSNSKEIDDQVNMLLKTKFSTSSISDLANHFNEEKYLLPRRYNQENKITRYYRVVFLTSEELSNLSSFNLLFESEFSDGLVINLLANESQVTSLKKFAREQLERIKDSRVILRLPCQEIDDYFIKSIKKCGALEKLSASVENKESIYQAEIKLMFEENVAEINKSLNKFFNNKSEFISLDAAHNDFKACLNKLMEKTFTEHLKFNNELVNKNHLTSQYQKPVNNVVNYILSGDDEKTNPFPYSETSPETSVFNAVVKHFKGCNDKNIVIIKKHLSEMILSSESKPISIKEISAYLSEAPRGIRKGLHSLLIAMVLISLSDSNIILKLQSKEVDLNADNLYKAIYSNSEYTLNCTHSSEEQRSFVAKMFTLFSVKTSENFRSDIKLLSTQIRSFFLGLPKIIRNTTLKNNFLELSSEIITYKNLFLSFNINSSEVVLTKPVEIFGTYQIAYSVLENFVQSWETSVLSYKIKLEKIIRQVFAVDNKTNLKTGINHWLKNIIPDSKHLLLETFDSNLLQTLNVLSFNDQESTGNICYAATGNYIEDWEFDQLEKLSESLHKFTANIENAKTVDFNGAKLQGITTDITELSPLGSMLKENIKASFDEFGDSVTKEEKLQIISDLMKELL